MLSIQGIESLGDLRAFWLPGPRLQVLQSESATASRGSGSSWASRTASGDRVGEETKLDSTPWVHGSRFYKCLTCIGHSRPIEMRFSFNLDGHSPSSKRRIARILLP